MAVEFGVLIPTREAVMSGQSGDRSAPGHGRARGEPRASTRCGSATRSSPGPVTSRSRCWPPSPGRTRRVRLGTGVLLPALRNPVVLAHVVGTLDRAAEGRIILGVGFAADNPSIRKEFAAAGVPFERRVGRFLETLEICQALWRRNNVSFSGKHFTLDDVTMEPKPHRPGGPPIWIGGSGPTALRLAARYDAWFPTGPSVEFFAEHFPRVQAAARAAGRPGRRRDGRRVRDARARREPGRRRAAAGELSRDLLCGAGADHPGPPGDLRRPDRGLRRVAPALDRRRRAPLWRYASPAATSSPRSTRRRRSSCRGSPAADAAAHRDDAPS